MSDVVSKLVEINSFEGKASILGPQRQVIYAGEVSQADSELVIRGVSLADAMQILGVLAGGLLTGKDAENPSAAADLNKIADKLPPREQMVLDLTSKKPKAKPAPVEPDEAVPVLNSEIAAARAQPAPAGAYDLDFMAAQEKVRPVVEHLRDHGYKTVDAVVAVAKELVDVVPALTKIKAKKGNDYVKHMEMVATTILVDEAA